MLFSLVDSNASPDSPLQMLWTVACQASLSMGFFKQENWCGLPSPSPGDLSKPGIELTTHVSYIGSQVLYRQHQIIVFLVTVSQNISYLLIPYAFSLLSLIWVHWTQCMCAKSLQSCPTVCNTMNYSPPGSPWDSMGLSRQEYWSGLPCPQSRGFSDPGIKPKSLASPELAGGSFTTSPTLNTGQFLNTVLKSRDDSYKQLNKVSFYLLGFFCC